MSKITPKMDDIIMERAKFLGALGVPSVAIPHSDVPVIIGTWGNMIYELSQEANLKIDKQATLKLALAVSKSGLAMLGGIKIMSSVFSWGGITTPFAAAANGVANFYFTKSLGYRVAGILSRDHIRDTDVFTTLASGLGVAGIASDIIISDDIIIASSEGTETPPLDTNDIDVAAPPVNDDKSSNGLPKHNIG